MATDDPNLLQWEFPYCPKPPDWSLPWEAIIERFEWIRAMKDCPQDPVWHAEGDVQIHTRLVCEALSCSTDWRRLSSSERSIVFLATLMHDIAKPLVTREINGRIHAPRHASKGAVMARTILLTELLPARSMPQFRAREQIVNLVRCHGLPLYFLKGRDPRHEVIAASQTARCDWLAMIALADIVGRICGDHDEPASRIEFFREFCHEHQCWNGPRRFPSEHSRFLYLNRRQMAPECEIYDDTQTEVILMSGLPGAGKDSWLRQQPQSPPVISLDRIRSELSISPGDNQGPIINAAREQAMHYLRRGETFVWNATNTTWAMREQLIRLFRRYGAHIRIVYHEAAWNSILQRNQSRDAPVPVSVLEKLMRKLSVPDVTEAHHVDISIT